MNLTSNAELKEQDKCTHILRFHLYKVQTLKKLHVWFRDVCL